MAPLAEEDINNYLPYTYSMCDCCGCCECTCCSK